MREAARYVALAGCVVLVGSCAGGASKSTEGPPGLSEGDTSDSSGSPTTLSSTSQSSTTAPPSTVSSADSTTTGGSSTGSSDSSGSTTSSCTELWRTEVSGVTAEELALGQGGEIYVIGNEPPPRVAHIVELDPCDGSVVTDVIIDHDDQTVDQLFLGDIVVDGEAIYVSGNAIDVLGDPQDGYYTGLNASDFSQIFSQPLVGSAGSDETRDLALNSTGRLWTAGSVLIIDGPKRSWQVRADTAGSACGFAWGPSPAGGSRAVVTHGGNVYVLAIDELNQAVVLRYPDDDCECACMPDAVSPGLQIGTATTEVSDAVIVDGQIYVAGWANDGSDIYGYVAWLDLDGTLVDTYEINATAAEDGYFQIVTDGSNVYAGGLDGNTGTPGFAEASARLDVLEVPLPANDPVVWTGAPDELDYIAGLTVDDETLYVSGNAGGEAVIVSCTKDGVCG